MFGTKGGGPITVTRSPRARKPRSRGRLVLLLVVLLGALAAFLIVRSLSSGSDEPQVQVKGATVDRAAPVAPAPAPTGIPMSVEGTSVTVDSAARTYRATVSVRNPTDLPASDISIEVTVRDSNGAVVKTESRHLEALASGGTASVEFTGEFAANSPVPATVEAKATAVSTSA